MKTVNWLMLSAFILYCPQVAAQQIEEKFMKEIEYLSYKPAQYSQDTLKKWPLVIFLHGSGEQGTDLERVKVHGPPMLVEQGKEFPFILISPQAQRGWDAEFLYDMIMDFAKNNRVDMDRIYLTGLSMGGHGTWTLAQKHPELFAAIVPICGSGGTKDLWKLRNMPVWCFHGEKDTVVPFSASQVKVDTLRTYNPSVKFTSYPEVGHDSWVKAYNDPELYQWLLSQKKFKYSPKRVSSDKLSEYEGKYHYKIDNKEGDVTVTIEGNQLQIDIEGRKTTLIAFAEHKFYIEGARVEFEFLRNRNGKFDHGRVFGNEIINFYRVEE
jgi:predicted esterase